MHDTEFVLEHMELTEEERAEIARFISSQEAIELKTVGIDVSSSTSHLLFAKVTQQPQAPERSARFSVVDREILWRSPIMLTPFRSDGTIDATRLGQLIAKSYDAGVRGATATSARRWASSCTTNSICPARSCRSTACSCRISTMSTSAI